LSVLDFPSAFPKMRSPVALKRLQIHDFAANLDEFVFQQVSDDFTRIAATVPQMEKLFDEVESGHVVGSVGGETYPLFLALGAARRDARRSESCRLSVRLAVLPRRFGLRP
jgi:hypothetical protein